MLEDSPLAEIVDIPRQRAFGATMHDILPKHCREREVRFASNGGCPKDRFLHAPAVSPDCTTSAPATADFSITLTLPCSPWAQLHVQRRPANEVLELVAKKRLLGYKMHK